MDAEIKVSCAEDPELSNVSFLKPDVAQNIALHALLTAGNSAFLISALPVHSTSFSPILFKCKVTCVAALTTQ